MKFSAQLGCTPRISAPSSPLRRNTALRVSRTASARPTSTASAAPSVSSLPASTTPSISTSSSTMASAMSAGRPLASAVERNSVRPYDTTFSLAFSPSPLTGVAAPMVPPGAMYKLSQAIAMRAPALMARGLTYAIVSRSVSMRASRISIIASRRPPNVLMSTSSASASSSSASCTARRMKGANPMSIMPSTGTRTTILSSDCAGTTRASRANKAAAPRRKSPTCRSAGVCMSHLAPGGGACRSVWGSPDPHGFAPWNTA